MRLNKILNNIHIYLNILKYLPNYKLKVLKSEFYSKVFKVAFLYHFDEIYSNKLKLNELIWQCFTS